MLRLWLTRSRCHRTARALQSYLDGELELASAEAVAEHLEVCRRCGLEAETYAAIKTAIAGRTSRGDRMVAGRPPVDPAAVARLDRFARSLTEGG